MGYSKLIPVGKENIKVGKKYFTCNYGGTVAATVIKVFTDVDSVLVKTGNKNSKPFVRQCRFIFDDADMARLAMRDWEHDERKRKKKRK